MSKGRSGLLQWSEEVRCTHCLSFDALSEAVHRVISCNCANAPLRRCWTYLQEDDLLQSLYATHGAKWSLIAQSLKTKESKQVTVCTGMALQRPCCCTGTLFEIMLPTCSAGDAGRPFRMRSTRKWGTGSQT